MASQQPAQPIACDGSGVGIMGASAIAATVSDPSLDRASKQVLAVLQGTVYYAKIDGSHIVEVSHPFLTPNGIGLSPDDRTLYVAETEGGRLF